MSQEPSFDESTIYSVIDLATKQAAVVQGQSVTITIDFAGEELEADDTFSLPLFADYADTEVFARLSGKAYFDTDLTDPEHKKLLISFPGDKTSFWDRKGYPKYHLLELEGVLNHKTAEGKERPRSGRVLVKVPFRLTGDKS